MRQANDDARQRVARIFREEEATERRSEARHQFAKGTSESEGRPTSKSFEAEVKTIEEARRSCDGDDQHLRPQRVELEYGKSKEFIKTINAAAASRGIVTKMAKHLQR